MKVRYFVLGLLAGVVACAIVLAVAIAVLVSRPTPQPPPPASPRSGDITVVVQEGYLGQMATEMARQQEPMLGSVAVDVRPGGRVDMLMGLQMKILGQTMDLQVQLISAVSVDNGRLRFDLQQIQFAGLDIPLDLLPQSMRTMMDRMVADATDRANRMLTESGLVLLSVTTDESSITVSLQAR